MQLGIARVTWLVFLLAAIIVPAHARAQPAPDDVDPQLARLIASIPAIDHHAHPLLPPPNLASDRNFDALPVDNMEPETDPVAWRPGSLQLADAWSALWHFTEAPPLSPEARQLLAPAQRGGDLSAGPGQRQHRRVWQRVPGGIHGDLRAREWRLPRGGQPVDDVPAPRRVAVVQTMVSSASSSATVWRRRISRAAPPVTSSTAASGRVL